MFRFNQKKANREADEVKKLLAITKGMRTPAKSISSSFLKEDVAMGGDALGSTAPPTDMATPGETAETTDMKEIENAIDTAKIDKIDANNVEGTATEGKISFSFDRDETSAKFKVIEDTELTADVVKIIGQIAAYFDIWKKKNP